MLQNNRRHRYIIISLNSQLKVVCPTSRKSSFDAEPPWNNIIWKWEKKLNTIIISPPLDSIGMNPSNWILEMETVVDDKMFVVHSWNTERKTFYIFYNKSLSRLIPRVSKSMYPPHPSVMMVVPFLTRFIMMVSKVCLSLRLLGQISTNISPDSLKSQIVHIQNTNARFDRNTLQHHQEPNSAFSPKFAPCGTFSFLWVSDIIRKITKMICTKHGFVYFDGGIVATNHVASSNCK